MNYMKYSERQLNILNGAVRLITVPDFELLRFREQALYQFDSDTVHFLDAELIQRGSLPIDNRITYTNLQKTIITGEKPITGMSSQQLKVFYSIAKKQCDKSTADMIRAELESRENWFPVIEPYEPRQSALLLGLEDINSAGDQTLYALGAAAYRNCDFDLCDQVNGIIEDKGLRPEEYFGGQTIILLQGIHNGIGKDALRAIRSKAWAQTYYIARHYSIEKLVNQMEQIMEESIRKVKADYFTADEKALMNAEELISVCDEDTLKRLVTKAEWYKEAAEPGQIERIEHELQERQRRWEEAHRWETEYTEQQKSMIRGEMPLYNISTKSLHAIIRKAQKRGDTQIEQYFQRELDARSEWQESGSQYTERQKMIIASAEGFDIAHKDVHAHLEDLSSESESACPIALEHEPEKKPRRYVKTLRETVAELRDDQYYQDLKELDMATSYTKRQRRILDGEIPFSEVRPKELRELIEKARENRDDDRADEMEDYMKDTLRYGVRADRPANRSSEGHDAPDYTDTDKSVIYGTIPYEAISLNDAKELAKRARQNKDVKTLELADMIILEKEGDSYERIREESRKRRKIRGTTPSYVPKKDEQWAIRVLESLEDPDYLSTRDIVDIRAFARTLDNPEYLQVADRLFEVKKNPSIIYTAKTRREALDILQEHTWGRFKIPEDWLV